MTITHPLTLSRTCEALAFEERHTLHAVGEVQLPDVPCEKEDREMIEEKGGRRVADKVRNEEAIPQNNLIKPLTFLNLILNSAVPVRPLHQLMVTDCMPSGSTILSTAPAEGKVKREGIG